ncbi:DUF3119 family protein [Roseofilum reptotaenium CS-1145]|uniref:Glycerol dehydrogenase n=1 Tax=Roseofilum reptotaenium AO1-A TaxID=1925591 RepID=A0A1L9QLY4_9CYAN|nr:MULTISPECIES: DUF3119 family protein [Roseofilum]OJJ20715.1 glycerol dehydrogenase [Roseofilum reptotaenium AO1-A]MBP0013505.1 DUF3119 family protein [Roseofilum sp. SID3]MBP0024703.1 DUF3119 family protein [Roseofilum sp. SID2]MBP0039510.1 DUF3119 family protein [Roseofilum sp. SID1]MBP0042536.1 DUF3119 family protein [Roseofilum sp. SBFL]
MTSTPFSSSTSSTTLETVTLKPSYRIPLVLVLLAIPLAAVQIGLGGAIALFGLFLTLQTTTIRLTFTPTALEVYRSDKQIRQFPYQDWQNWEIFWDKLPILFYFKEVKSIHFVPIIFDYSTLKRTLEERCPRSR